MKSIGNSLAFWKSSPPENQFATNPTSPSSSFSPTGSMNTNSGGANSMASRPSTMPFGNTGRNSTAGGFGNNNGFGSNSGTTNSFASHNSSGMRSPYDNKMPGSTQNQSGFGTPRTAQNPNMTRPSNPSNGFSARGNGVSGGRGSFSAGGSNGGFGASNGMTTSPNNSFKSNGMNSVSPSQQFRNNSGGFQPNNSKFVPNNTGSFAPKSTMPPSTITPNTPMGKSPTSMSPSNTSPTNSSPASSSPSGNWKNYPNTNYPGFGSSSSKAPATSTNTGFQSKNVQASADMSPPPSLPSTVFDKKGGYAPGSTGTSGKASQAGFDTNDSLYSPPSGSKIPSTSNGLYSPN